MARRGSGRSRGGDVGVVLDLTDRAVCTLVGAQALDTPDEQYIEAILGAMRAAGALVAARGAGRHASVWQALAVAAPEFHEWAAYFEACGKGRRRVEMGVWSPTWQQADEALTAARRFFTLVQAALGLPPSVPEWASSTVVSGQRRELMGAGSYG